MADERKRSRWRIAGGWLLVLLPVLYVASWFLFIPLMQYGWISIETAASIDPFYVPLDWVAQQSPWFHDFRAWYVGWIDPFG